MPITIDVDDPHISFREREKRRAHQKRMNAKSVKDQDGIDTIMEGKCPYCEGPARIFMGYAWSSLVCKNYICWRTRGTLDSD